MYQKTISVSLLEMKSSAYRLTYKMGICLDEESQIATASVVLVSKYL